MKELKEIAERLEKKADELAKSNDIQDIQNSSGLYIAAKEVYKYMQEIQIKQLYPPNLSTDLNKI